MFFLYRSPYCEQVQLPTLQQFLHLFLTLPFAAGGEDDFPHSDSPAACLDGSDPCYLGRRL